VKKRARSAWRRANAFTSYRGTWHGSISCERFRLVIIPFRPFQHLLEVRQQVDCLDCVQKHLARAGRLILDVSRRMPSGCTIPCTCARCW